MLNAMGSQGSPSRTPDGEADADGAEDAADRHDVESRTQRVGDVLGLVVLEVGVHVALSGGEGGRRGAAGEGDMRTEEGTQSQRRGEAGRAERRQLASRSRRPRPEEGGRLADYDEHPGQRERLEGPDGGAQGAAGERDDHERQQLSHDDHLGDASTLPTGGTPTRISLTVPRAVRPVT